VPEIKQLSHSIYSGSECDKEIYTLFFSKQLEMIDISATT